ncbi:MAG: type II toxin-antitoxin system HicA family toxin [Chlamydiales bacterium]
MLSNITLSHRDLIEGSPSSSSSSSGSGWLQGRSIGDCSLKTACPTPSSPSSISVAFHSTASSDEIVKKAVDSTLVRLTPLEKSYVQELKQRHPFCQRMPFSFVLLALHSDCVNRIKEIAKSTIMVLYPPSSRYYVDKEKSGLQTLMDSQTTFLTALIFSWVKAIEAAKGLNFINEEDVSQAIHQHQSEMEYAQEVYQEAQQFISGKKKTSSAQSALPKITEILGLIRRMSACIDMLRECAEVNHFESSSDPQLEDVCMDQKTLDKEINFVRNLILDLVESSLFKKMAIPSYAKEFLSTSHLMQQINRKFTPSDMIGIGKVTSFSRILANNFDMSDPLNTYLHYHLLKVQYNLNQCLDGSLKERKLIQMNTQALNFCHTCIRLLPQLFATYDETSGHYFLPSELEGIFFMKKTLNTSFSLFNYYDSMEKVKAIVPFIGESAALIEKEVANTIQSIESCLHKLSHPISKEVLISLQNEIDEAVTPAFLRLFLLRLLVESVEKLLLSPGCKKKFQLSSTPVQFSHCADQTTELRWYEDLAKLKERLNVSLIYEQLMAQQAVVELIPSILCETNSTMVADASHSTLPPDEVECLVSEVTTSTQCNRKPSCSKTIPVATSHSKRNKRKVIPPKKVVPLPFHPIKRPSDIAEELLTNNFSDLQMKKYRHLERFLLSSGFVKKSTRGSHEKWILPSKSNGDKMVIVPRSSSTIPLGTLHSILNGVNSILHRIGSHE